MIARMPDHSEFRWGRAALHAVLALVLVIAVTSALAAIYDVADPQRFGEGVGRLSLFMMLGAVGVSYLFQTGRRAAAGIVGGLMLTLLVVLVVATMMVMANRDEPAEPMPAVELVREGSMLRHPTRGFSIPDPGPAFAPQPELAASQIPPTPDSHAWVYADTAQGEALILILDSGGATDSKTFEEFFGGVLRGQRSAMDDAGMAVEERERWVKWDDRRAHAYLVVSQTLHLRVDAFGLEEGEALVVVSSALQEERFAALADGVKIDAS